MGEFETKEERLKRLNRERVDRYRQKHGDSKFNVTFYGDEVENFLIPLRKRLEEDGITRKEFLIKSFEEYVKRGGFSDS